MSDATMPRLFRYEHGDGREPRVGVHFPAGYSGDVPYVVLPPCHMSTSLAEDFPSRFAGFAWIDPPPGEAPAPADGPNLVTSSADALAEVREMLKVLLKRGARSGLDAAGPGEGAWGEADIDGGGR